MQNDVRSSSGIMIPFSLFIAALALRSYSALVPGVIVPDGILYINTAKMIDAGEWGKIAQYSFFNLYPFLIALFHRVIPDWELSARTLSVLCGSLAVVPFYWMTRRLFDKRLALAVSVFFIISPRLVEYSSNVIREPVFWLFSLSALCAAVRGLQEKQSFYMMLSALFVGLSAFTRMEGLALVPVIMIWACWQYRVERSLGFNRFLILLIVFLFSFPVLFFSPLVILKGVLGHWEFGHIASKVPQILSGGNDHAEQTFLNNLDESDVITRVISGNKYLVFLWQPILKFFRSYHVLFIILFIVGIVRRKVIPYNSREMLFWFWWAAFFTVSILYVSKIYYLSTRHGMLMGLPGLLWVSIGFYELAGLLDKWGIRTRFALIGRLKNGHVILAMAILCAVVLPKTLSWSGLDKIEMKRAGVYLKQMGCPDKKIAVEARLSRVGFYSGSEYVTIPESVAPSQVSAFLRSEGIHCLIVDKRTMGKSMARFVEDPASSNLQPIQVDEFDRYKNYSFVLFFVKK